MRETSFGAVVAFEKAAAERERAQAELLIAARFALEVLDDEAGTLAPVFTLRAQTALRRAIERAEKVARNTAK